MLLKLYRWRRKIYNRGNCIINSLSINYVPNVEIHDTNVIEIFSLFEQEKVNKNHEDNQSLDLVNTFYHEELIYDKVVQDIMAN